MNIFYTNSDPLQCAKDHCTIHTNKMAIEGMQLLSTAHHVLDGDKAIQGIYKSTHVNHPCAVWVRRSAYNYLWLWSLTDALISIYTQNTGKEYAGRDVLYTLNKLPMNISGSSYQRFNPPKCMPDEFKQLSVEDSYKAYLNHKYHVWTTRTDKRRMNVQWYCGKPDWATFDNLQEAV